MNGPFDPDFGQFTEMAFIIPTPSNNLFFVLLCYEHWRFCDSNIAAEVGPIATLLISNLTFFRKDGRQQGDSILLAQNG